MARWRKVPFVGWQASLFATLAITLVGGCALPTVDQGPTLSQSKRTNKDLVNAKKHFARGEFGLAEKRYRSAVESDPGSPEAWLGLAASYDHLARYDLADRSYARARTMMGDSAVLLNNMGYSRMMRGDLEKAKRLFNRAQRKDPDDARIARNIDELNKRLVKAGRRPVSL